MSPCTAAWTLAALVIASAALQGSEVDPDPDCVTDSCVFAMCAADKGRPCTDDEVFGAVESDCADLPPDHPDACEGPR